MLAKPTLKVDGEFNADYLIFILIQKSLYNSKSSIIRLEVNLQLHKNALNLLPTTFILTFLLVALINFSLVISVKPKFI